MLSGDARHLPASAVRPGISYHFLEKCVRTLVETDPDSPLAAVLAPIVTENPGELEKAAAGGYHLLRSHRNLDEEERKFFSRLYFHLLAARFTDKTKQQLETMIAELVPLEETRVGKDLIEIGEKRGKQKNDRRNVLRIAAFGKSAGEIAAFLGIREKEVVEILDETGEER